MEHHNQDLATLLRGREPLILIMQSEDYPMVWWARGPSRACVHRGGEGPGHEPSRLRGWQQHAASRCAMHQLLRCHACLDTWHTQIWKADHWKLPAFSMCVDKDSTDLPVPDFTFEVRRWAAKSSALKRKQAGRS